MRVRKEIEREGRGVHYRKRGMLEKWKMINAVGGKRVIEGRVLMTFKTK